MAGLVKGIKGGIKRFFGSQDDDAAEEANDLNHAHSPELPEYLWGSTTASPQRTAAPVDPYEGHLLPNSSQSRLQDRPDNGKRQPSNATRAPDPAYGYLGPPASSMKKPDAGMGVQRINTLNGPLAFGTNPGVIRKKATTYSTLHRNAKSIGVERHGGQQAWLDQNPHHKPAISATRDVAYSPPLKRRKTENLNAAPRATIELVDSDEDEIQTLAPTRPTTPPRQASYVSSRSPHSATSRHSVRSSSRASQPASEFLTVTDSIAPKRAKPPRRKGPCGPDASRRVSQPEVLFEGAGTRTQEKRLAIYEDNKESPRTARSQILQTHKQGVRDESSDNEIQLSTGLTSKHFASDHPQMRINESTEAELTAKVDRNRVTQKLQQFRHAEQASEVQDDPIASSGDELAPDSRSRKSPAKKMTAKKATVKRGSTVGKCYQLEYARSYGFGPDWEHLSLEHIGNVKKFRIDGHDSDGNVTLLKMLDIGSVTKVTSDNVRSMRLAGPIKNGDRYWCDLTFTKLIDFNEFRSQFIDPEVDKQHTATKADMQKLFNVPFEKNDKIGTQPMVNEETVSGQPSREHGRKSRIGLISTMAKSSKDADNAIPRRVEVSTPLLPRAARATRATAPIYDQEHFAEKEPERYSVIHGLGKRWAKPLDYSVDSGFLKRRKATIEYDDLEKLDEGQMLNDSIMTFYMLYLFITLNVSIDQVYFFNTHFFPTLFKKGKGQDGINYEAVRSWTKRDDVFSYDYLVVPMHEDLHWYLGIICNVNNIIRKSEHEPLQEDSPDLDHGPASLHASDIATASSGDISSAVPSGTIAVAIAPDDAVDTKDNDNDDINLFEEEKELDLVDPNAETANGHEHKLSERTVEDEVSTEALTPAALKESSSKLASGKARQASRKKRAYKPPARDPDKPVIMMLDSLGQTRTAATRALRQWLEAEGRDKRGLDVEIDNKGLYPKGTQIPTQNNYSDCGLYVLGYLRKFFLNPDEFTKKLLRSEMSAESDWPDMDTSKMREEIRDLIFELNDARNGARKEAHKAKKRIGSKDPSPSPAKAESKVPSPAVKQIETAETQAAAVAATVPEATPISAATADKTVTPPADALRLGSPFRPESMNKKRPSPDMDAAPENNTARTSSTAQDLPSEFTSTPTRQRQSLAKRANSPEVRVPATSPLDLSTYKPFDSASDPTTQPNRQSADLTRPLQNHDMHVKDNGKLRMPSAKSRKMSSPSKPPHNPPARSSPSQARTRSGSHDDPIPVDDSQDLDGLVKNQSQSARKPPPEIIELDRSRESVRPPARQGTRHAQSSPIRQREGRRLIINRDDSIREINGDDWQEGVDISRALKLSLLDEAEQLNRQRELDGLRNDVFDAQAAYSQSSHTVHEVQETQHSQLMDIDHDDREVPESPVQRRGSPASDVMMMD